MERSWPSGQHLHTPSPLATRRYACEVASKYRAITPAAMWHMVQCRGAQIIHNSGCVLHWMLKCQEADRGCLLKYTRWGLFVDIDPNNRGVSASVCIVPLWGHLSLNLLFLFKYQDVSHNCFFLFFLLFLVLLKLKQLLDQLIRQLLVWYVLGQIFADPNCFSNLIVTVEFLISLGFGLLLVVTFSSGSSTIILTFYRLNYWWIK